MKFLEKGIYKIFGAILLVSMIGALVAEPVAVSGISKLSDENVGLYYYQLYKEGKITKDQYDEAMQCWNSVLVLSGVCLAIPGLQEVGVAGSVSYALGTL